MKKKIYIETTIPSYYVGKSSKDIIILARQEITRDWWNDHRQYYDLFISDIVIEEVSRGDKESSEKRIELIQDIKVLEQSPEIEIHRISISGLMRAGRK